MKNKKILISLGIIGCLAFGISTPIFLSTCSNNKSNIDDENQWKPSVPGETVTPTIDFVLAPSYVVGQQLIW